MHVGNVTLPDWAYIPAYWATTGCCLNVVNSGQILTLALLQRNASGAGENVVNILKATLLINNPVLKISQIEKASYEMFSML